MSTYYGSDYIYSVLNGNTGVTDLVGTAIYNARLVPDTETSTSTINFYRESPVNNALDYGDYSYTLNCRALTDVLSIQIANAVSAAINRVQTNLSGAIYFGIVSILPTIPPADDGDVYNTPVNILIKSKE